MPDVRLLPWLAELARTLPGVPGAYGPQAAIDPRARQRLLATVAGDRGCRWCAFVHGTWATWLGEGDVGEPEAAMIGHARACAAAGRPVDAAPLAAVLSPEGVRAVRATVAAGTVGTAVGGALDRLVDRTRRRRVPSPAALAADLAIVGAALPLALPLLGAAAGMSVVNRLAAGPPPVAHRPGEEPNLLAHLLARAGPQLLAPAPARLAVRALPVDVVVGVSTGRSSATVRVGRGRVVVENGIAADAVVVVEGDLGPLLGQATGALVRDLSALRLRPT